MGDTVVVWDVDAGGVSPVISEIGRDSSGMRTGCGRSEANRCIQLSQLVQYHCVNGELDRRYNGDVRECDL